MLSQRRIRDIGLLVLMLAAALGLALTGDSDNLKSLATQGAAPNTFQRVNDSQLQTARFMARFASTLEERQFAQDAIRLADEGLDLMYAAAIHDAAEYPPPSTPEIHIRSMTVNADSVRVKADQDAIEKTTEQLGLANPGG